MRSTEMAVTTIRRGTEFTGFTVRTHKACGSTTRTNVGKDWFSRLNSSHNGTGREFVPCNGCGKALDLFFSQPVMGRFVESKVCDGKCMGARGTTCDCSCGGELHGKNHGG
jgi:hypothetical protein